MYTKNEKGSSLVVMLLVLVIVLAGVFLYFKKIDKINNPGITKPKQYSVDETAPEFEVLEEDSSTPEEIDNDFIDELDELIMSIEGEADDLSDLDY